MDYKKLLEKAKKEVPKEVCSKERFEIPPVKGHIQGTKTIVSNLQQIANQMHRPIDHILKYLQKELATPADIKSNGSTIFGRKVSSAEINSKIKQYADEFLFCKECCKPDTEFLQEGDIVFVKCMVCGAKTPAKTKM